MQLLRDYSPAGFCNKVLGLAKLGKVFRLPTVLTVTPAMIRFLRPVFSIPGYDLRIIPRADDHRHIREHADHLWDKRAVRTLAKARRINWTAVAAELQRDCRQPTR